MVCALVWIHTERPSLPRHLQYNTSTYTGTGTVSRWYGSTRSIPRSQVPYRTVLTNSKMSRLFLESDKWHGNDFRFTLVGLGPCHRESEEARVSS
jgi:hypothetical protein